MNGEFCDTNVFVYAYDASASQKQEQATQLIDRLWRSGRGVVSVQVLQELYVTLTRRLPGRRGQDLARARVEELMAWRVVSPTEADVLAAIDGSLRWRVSFWDAMLLTTAKEAGAEILWSEDLNHGQDYDGLVVRNPFVE